MKRVVFVFMIPVVIACVSQRERRQLAFRAESAGVTVQRDSTWQLRRQGSWSLELLGLEAWIGSTDRPAWPSDRPGGHSSPTNGLTDPAEGNNAAPAGFTGRPALQRVRLARLTLRSDSTSESRGRLTDSATGFSAREETQHLTATGKTTGPGWSTGVGLTLIVLVALVIPVIRQVFR